MESEKEYRPVNFETDTIPRHLNQANEVINEEPSTYTWKSDWFQPWGNVGWTITIIPAHHHDPEWNLYHDLVDSRLPYHTHDEHGVKGSGCNYVPDHGHKNIVVERRTGVYTTSVDTHRTPYGILDAKFCALIGENYDLEVKVKELEKRIEVLECEHCCRQVKKSGYDHCDHNWEY